MELEFISHRSYALAFIAPLLGGALTISINVTKGERAGSIHWPHFLRLVNGTRHLSFERLKQHPGRGEELPL